MRAAVVSRAILIDIRERGHAHVRHVDGAMSEWARRGWPRVARLPEGGAAALRRARHRAGPFGAPAA
ncbi:MAG: hypothetical protein NTW15_23190 [Burkholderiales bacterium]|nr:hypothetical protein [Burkholderiales bacterium]